MNKEIVKNIFSDQKDTNIALTSENNSPLLFKDLKDLEELLDIDKESGGLLSSLEKKEDSKTNEMTSYTNLLSRPTSSTTYK